MSKWYDSFSDPRWQKKRLEILERDGWACRACGSGIGDGVSLNVHHAFYASGLDPWDYHDNSLVTFCKHCHEHRHELQDSALHAISNRSTKALLGMKVAAFRFEKTLEALSEYEQESIYGTDLAKSKSRALKVDIKIAAYAKKILDREYKRKGV